MLKRANRLNRKKINEGFVCLKTDDIYNFSADKKYNTVLFANVLYFWNNLDAAFSKIKELLIPDGKLVFFMTDGKMLAKNKMTNSSEFNKYSSKQVKESLLKSGFKTVEINNINDTSGDFLIIKAY
jgi:predicted TPR repeat methyltransferase